MAKRITLFNAKTKSMLNIIRKNEKNKAKVTNELSILLVLFHLFPWRPQCFYKTLKPNMFPVQSLPFSVLWQISTPTSAVSLPISSISSIPSIFELINPNIPNLTNPHVPIFIYGQSVRVIDLVATYVTTTSRHAPHPYSADRPYSSHIHLQ